MPATVILTLAICLWLYLDNANVAPQFDYCKGCIVSFAINLVSKHLTMVLSIVLRKFLQTF